MADNVYSNAKILKNEEVQKYELGTFINSQSETNVVRTNSNSVLDDREINKWSRSVLIEVRNLTAKLNEIS